MTATVGSRTQRRSHLDQICEQIATVLDPLAVRCRGWPAEAIAPVLARSWQAAFGGELGEPGLSDAAAAISDGRPWTHALWTDGW